MEESRRPLYLRARRRIVRRDGPRFEVAGRRRTCRTPLDMAKVGVPANDAFAAWATSLLDHVLPTTLPAKWLDILLFDQQQKIGITPIRVNPVGMLFAKGGQRRRADPHPGWRRSRFPRLVGSPNKPF